MAKQQNTAQQFPQLEEGQICPTADEAASGYLICNDQRVIEIIPEGHGIVARTVHYPNPVGTKQVSRLYQGLIALDDGDALSPSVVDVSKVTKVFPLTPGSCFQVHHHFSGDSLGLVHTDRFEVLKLGKIAIGQCQYRGLEVTRTLSSNRDPHVGTQRLLYVPDLKNFFIRSTAKMVMSDSFIHPLASRQTFLDLIRSIHVQRWGE